MRDQGALGHASCSACRFSVLSSSLMPPAVEGHKEGRLLGTVRKPAQQAACALPLKQACRLATNGEWRWSQACVVAGKPSSSHWQGRPNSRQVVPRPLKSAKIAEAQPINGPQQAGCSPDRKWMPGTLAGMVRSMVLQQRKHVAATASRTG